MGSHHCWLSDRPLHMTDVKLFTHAFSANVSTESAHFKHDGLITPWNFYKYHTLDMYGAAQRRANRISQNNNNRETSCMLSQNSYLKFT